MSKHKKLPISEFYGLTPGALVNPTIRTALSGPRSFFGPAPRCERVISGTRRSQGAAGEIHTCFGGLTRWAQDAITQVGTHKTRRRPAPIVHKSVGIRPGSFLSRGRNG